MVHRSRLAAIAADALRSLDNICERVERWAGFVYSWLSSVETLLRGVSFRMASGTEVKSCLISLLRRFSNARASWNSTGTRSCRSIGSMRAVFAISSATSFSSRPQCELTHTTSRVEPGCVMISFISSICPATSGLLTSFLDASAVQSYSCSMRRGHTSTLNSLNIGTFPLWEEVRN